MAGKRNILLILFLVLIYGVGIAGIMSPGFRETIVPLTPITLTLTALALLWSEPSKTPAFYIWSVLVVIVGFSVEVIGVKTGALFGDYIYGSNLGPKAFGVPLVIAINWWIVVYTSIEITRKYVSYRLGRAMLGGLVLVLLDVLIEPVAIKLDYWTWNNSEIPLFNYMCWYGIGALLMYLRPHESSRLPGPVAINVFLILVLFFGTLSALL